MEKTYKKIEYSLVIFGLFCLSYNIREFMTNKYSKEQGITFIVECILGIILIFLPDMVRKIFKLQVSDSIVYLYWFFLFLSVFLGTSLHVISLIFFWDKVLHSMSPMLLTAVGYGIIGYFLQKIDKSNLSPWFYILFGFAFAGLCGVFWEFWEFICDSVGNMNLQRYDSSSGKPFIGRAALMDTMGDLATNTVGAAIMGLYSIIHSKGNISYFDKYYIRKIK